MIEQYQKKQDGENTKAKQRRKRKKTQKVKIKKLLASLYHPRDHKCTLDMYLPGGIEPELDLGRRLIAANLGQRLLDCGSLTGDSLGGGFLLIMIFLGGLLSFISSRDSWGGGFLLIIIFLEGLLLFISTRDSGGGGFLLIMIFLEGFLTMSLIRIFLGCEAGPDCPSGVGDGLREQARGGEQDSAEGREERGGESSIDPRELDAGACSEGERLVFMEISSEKEVPYKGSARRQGRMDCR